MSNRIFHAMAYLTNPDFLITLMATQKSDHGVRAMYKVCKTEESVRRQREFENALLAMMETVPYSNVSVTDLCSRVGIARKNFYRYFENRDDVLCALLDHTILDFSGFPFDSPDPIVRYLSYWEQQKPLLDALEANGLSTRLIERTLAHAWETDSGFLRLLGENDDPNTVLFVVSGIVTLVVTWHHRGFSESKESLAQTILRLMTQPIVTLPE